MNFRKFIFVLLVFWLSSQQLIIAADNEVENTTTVLFNNGVRPQNPNRPLAPSNARIYFSYEAQSEECRFTLRPEIEYMSVEIEDLTTHALYLGEVDAADPVMHQPLTRGDYYITCTTDDGSIYAGEIFIK